MENNQVSKYQFLAFVDYQNLDKWYVSYYLNPHKIESEFSLEKLEKFIIPVKNKIPKKSYDGSLDVISKISFADGKLHLRPERKTGMDLYLLEKGHLLVSKINFHQGALAINDIGELVCSTHYQPYKIINPEIYPPYLTMALRAKPFQNFLTYLRADGIKNEATYEFIKDLVIPFPSLSYQENLVNEYQSKVQKADLLKQESNDIEKEKYLDQKLGIETKNRVVNTGKLSFIEFNKISKWGLDQIFNSQTIYNIKYNTLKIEQLCSVGSGGTPSRSNKAYYKGDIPWIKTGEVINDIIYNTEEKISNEAIKNSSAKIYPKDSLIIAMYGQGKTRGRTAKLGVDAATNQACAVLYNIKSKVLVDYLWVYLMNEYKRLRALASGNNQPNLNADMIKNYPVVVPPINIQEKIIDDFFKLKTIQKQKNQEADRLQSEALTEFENTIFNI